MRPHLPHPAPDHRPHSVVPADTLRRTQVAAPPVRRRRTEPAVDPAPVKPSRIAVLNHPLASYYLILGVTLTLLVLGLIMVLSASSVTSYASNGSSFSYFTRQLMWVTLGFPVMLVAMHLPVRRLRWIGLPLLALSILGLVLVLIPGIGLTAYGATRWISFGPIRIQPSEPVKIALILWGADMLARKYRWLPDWRHLAVPLLPVFGLVTLLVMLEPDLGTTLTILVILLSLLLTVGAAMRLFVGLFAFITVGVTLLAVLEPYRMRRLTTFMDPFADMQGAGFQVVQGIYALSSGGWFGLGLGASREKWSWLPNAHTDYVFAIIGEELGLVGTLATVSMFGLLAFAGLRIARRTRDRFVLLAATAITTWIVAQAFINIGAVIGVTPVTGIPLPLVSFGGSAMLPTMMSLGVLMAFARSEPAARAHLAERAEAKAQLRAQIRAEQRQAWSEVRRDGKVVVSLVPRVLARIGLALLGWWLRSMITGVQVCVRTALWPLRAATRPLWRRVAARMPVRQPGRTGRSAAPGRPAQVAADRIQPEQGLPRPDQGYRRAR